MSLGLFTPSQTNGGTESPTSFTNVHNVDTSPASVRCHPHVLPGQRLHPLFAISSGDILLEVLPLAPLRAQHGQRPGRQQVRWKKGSDLWGKIHAKALPGSKLIYISSVKG